jgi:hypothetical protein
MATSEPVTQSDRPTVLVDFALQGGGAHGAPVRECQSRDTILIPINPIERRGTPNTARDILNRVNEVSFNAVLRRSCA